MRKYNPDQAPNPVEWLALDEQKRIQLVEAHHREARAKLPNLRAHATFQVIVENQIAEGHEPVVRAISRLTTEGLSRHDALHAVASVLAEHMFDLFNAKADESDSAAIYNAAVERLTARSWRNG